MLRQTTVALAIAPTLGGAFIAHATSSLPTKAAGGKPRWRRKPRAAEVMAEEATAAGMVAAPEVGATEVAGYGGAYGGYFGPAYGFGGCLPVPVPIVGCW